MIKLIPLIIFPLSFFLIFLGVKNLTGNFPLDEEKITQNETEEIKKYNQDSDEKKRKIVTDIEKNYVNVDENLTKTDEIEKNSLNKANEKEIIEKNKPLLKSEKMKSRAKESQETISNIPTNIEIKDIYLIQFGAFSKKKNAEDLKNSVMKKINTKFPDFLIKVNFDEEKKLYKLISHTNHIDNAREVCSFFKEIKISCLFKKK